MRSRIDGTLPKMTTPLMDNTVPITTGTTHAAASRPTATASCPHPAATNPAYDHVMQYAWVAMHRRRSLAEEQGREPDSDRDQADDCQRMEDAERVLSMQRQRRHVHENERKDVDGSDHSVGVRALRHEENGGTRKQR